MSDIEQIALQAKRLRDDEAFNAFVKRVRDSQTGVFLNPDSSTEDREAAHAVIRGLHGIEGELTAAINAGTFEQHRKGQHRGSD